MARISKTEHPRILQMVQVEQRRVADVAAEYGCTPAAIYALLSKLRREPPPSPAPDVPQASPSRDPDPSVAASDPPTPAVAAPPVADLFATTGQAVAKPAAKRGAPVVAAATGRLAAEPPKSDARESTAAPATTPEATVTNLPARGDAKKGRGVGASLAKPGFGLVMRTPEGDESLTPFRSLDDLLSAVKPILRAAARSPDPVWFSIQPVDLASLDSDAA